MGEALGGAQLVGTPLPGLETVPIRPAGSLPGGLPHLS